MSSVGGHIIVVTLGVEQRANMQSVILRVGAPVAPNSTVCTGCVMYQYTGPDQCIGGTF